MALPPTHHYLQAVQVQLQRGEKTEKDDESPVTVADYGAQVRHVQCSSMTCSYLDLCHCVPVSAACTSLCHLHGCCRYPHPAHPRPSVRTPGAGGVEPAACLPRPGGEPGG